MSIFTYHLIEALTGHAQPEGGATEVLVSDLLGHVYRTVPKSVLTEQQKDQHPAFSVTDNFPVALLLGGKGLAKGVDAPDPLATLPRTTPLQQATNTGPGAIAQGGVAAGERGVAIGGNVSNSPIITGNNNTVRHTNTGGGAYVEGNVDTKGGDFVGRDKKTTSYTAFDQSRQTVLGPQTNIAGDVNTSGGIFNSGNMNTGAPSSRADLLAELRKLLAAITQAGAQGILDEDSAVDISGAVQKAINQADKPTPDRQAIRKHLSTAKALIEPIPAASGLVATINAVSGLLT